MNTNCLDLDLDDIYPTMPSAKDTIKHQINCDKVEYNGTIAIYDNVIDKHTCEFILNTVQEHKTFQPSKIINPDGSASVSTVRTSEEIPITGHQQLTNIDDLLFRIFNTAILKYAVDMSHRLTNREDYSVLNVSTDDGYTLLRYTPGSHYKLHVDQNTKANGDKKLRIVSAILYLNENFKGGGTHFISQNTTVHPKLGRLVLFPSSYSHSHESVAVVQGVKHAVVTWYR